MGGIVSMHGDKRRTRLGQELNEIEALVHYNFPPLSHAGSAKLMEQVLNDYFTDDKGRALPWHFEHTPASGQRSLFSTRSRVMRRHDALEAKHPFLS